MKNRFLGIGECMVELSGAGNGLLRQSFAGDVFNTLWYAKAVSGPQWAIQLYTAVGTDTVSEQMIGFIEQAGIDCSLVSRIPDRRPGLYMIHLDNGERSFSYWRETSAARLLARDKAALRDAIDGASIIYFSGITLAILSPDDVDYLLSCLATAAKNGKTIAFDPNIRPILWSSQEVMRETIQRAADHATIILPSYDDEAAAFGDATPAVTLKRYGKNSSALVILKNGPGSVLVGHQGNETDYPTDLIGNPVDTTGAGDSFNGAFLASYAQGGDIASSVSAAQKCAATVICNPGALVPQEKLRPNG
ncbi:MAG: sugar kinase [Stappiaceae bacterium]